MLHKISDDLADCSGTIILRKGAFSGKIFNESPLSQYNEGSTLFLETRMQVKLEGNVCQDIKKVSDKLSIIRLAENYKRDKTSPEQTVYWDIKVFERTQSDVDYFQVGKGDKLIIEGKLTEDEFEKEGVIVKKFAVIADSIRKVWRRPSAADDSKF